MGIILIISSISFAGIINLIEIASGSIYQWTCNSNQFTWPVNKEPIQTMVGNDIFTSGIDMDISFCKGYMWYCWRFAPIWWLHVRIWEL